VLWAKKGILQARVAAVRAAMAVTRLDFFFIDILPNVHRSKEE
jgi:hypothetical protein